MKKTTSLLMMIFLLTVMINGLAFSMRKNGKVTVNVTTSGQVLELPHKTAYLAITYPPDLGNTYITCYGTYGEGVTTPSSTTDYDYVVNEIIPVLFTVDEVGVYDSTEDRWEIGIIGDASVGQISILCFN